MRGRDAIAVVTLWVPLVTVVATWLSWRSALPADLPRQWGSEGVSTTWPTALAIVLAAFVCLDDWRGLKVVTWIMSISLKTIPLNAVKSVHTTRVDPLLWGGWGYRIRPGSSAIILRTGPGLIVTLTPQKSRRAERCRSATDRHNVLVSAGVHGSVKPYDTTFLRVDRYTSEEMRVDLVLKPHKNLIPLA